TMQRAAHRARAWPCTGADGMTRRGSDSGALDSPPSGTDACTRDADASCRSLRSSFLFVVFVLPFVRFVRASLYRHVHGTPAKPENEFAELKPQCTGEGNYIAGNSKYVQRHAREADRRRTPR